MRQHVKVRGAIHMLVAMYWAKSRIAKRRAASDILKVIEVGSAACCVWSLMSFLCRCFAGIVWGPTDTRGSFMHIEKVCCRYRSTPWYL